MTNLDFVKFKVHEETYTYFTDAYITSIIEFYGGDANADVDLTDDTFDWKNCVYDLGVLKATFLAGTGRIGDGTSDDHRMAARMLFAEMKKLKHTTSYGVVYNIDDIELLIKEQEEGE